MYKVRVNNNNVTAFKMPDGPWLLAFQKPGHQLFRFPVGEIYGANRIRLRMLDGL